MTKTILIVGYGPGVSAAVARKFGAEGYAVGLLARNQARLNAGVEALNALGVKARAFPADAGDPSALRAAVANVRAELGGVGVLHWNAYGGRGLGDLLSMDPIEARSVVDVAVVGLLSAVQKVLPDLKAAGDGAVLVTNGAFGDANPMIDALALSLHAEGVALGNAVKAKLAGLLAARLKNEGVHLAEVTIAGVVRGTGPESPGMPTIEADAVAGLFWDLFKARTDVRARIG